MEDRITEEFVSGFCKLQNQTRMVVCELMQMPDGSSRLISSDCAYGRCEHTGNCRLMGQVVHPD